MESYRRGAPAEIPVAPGDPRTLGYGTDQARWLKEELRRKQESDGAAANPFRAVIARQPPSTPTQTVAPVAYSPGPCAPAPTMQPAVSPRPAVQSSPAYVHSPHTPLAPESQHNQPPQTHTPLGAAQSQPAMRPLGAAPGQPSLRPKQAPAMPSHPAHAAPGQSPQGMAGYHMPPMHSLGANLQSQPSASPALRPQVGQVQPHSAPRPTSVEQHLQPRGPIPSMQRPALPQAVAGMPRPTLPVPQLAPSRMVPPGMPQPAAGIPQLAQQNAPGGPSPAFPSVVGAPNQGYAAPYQYSSQPLQPPPSPPRPFSYSPQAAQPAAPANALIREVYQRAPPSETPVAPGDPRTLGFGTDQARWLMEELRRKKESGETTSKFRMYGSQGQQHVHPEAPAHVAPQQGMNSQPSGAQVTALPPGWQQLQHEGHPYYLHTASGHTQWEWPQ